MREKTTSNDRLTDLEQRLALAEHDVRTTRAQVRDLQQQNQRHRLRRRRDGLLGLVALVLVFSVAQALETEAQGSGQTVRAPFTVVDTANRPILSVTDGAHRGLEISLPTGGELEKHLATEKRVDVYGIYFDFASDRLRAESGPVLQEIAGVLANNAGWMLTINGHTDNVGGEAFNLDLSRRRSAAVRRAPVDRYHVDAARLTTSGFGASQPKEDNATIEGRAKNRRVELVRQ